MRLGALKYLSPIRYMGTKIFANSIHAALTRPRFVPSSHFLDLRTARTAPAIAKAAKVIAQEMKQIERPLTATPRMRPSREIPYLSKSYLSKPAAVKGNGGLRGSTATRWK